MQKNSSMVVNLTEGNVAKHLLKFAMPLFVSNALQAIYNMVDMIVVGRYIGGTGMSAVSNGGEVLHLLTFIAMGFSSAGQVLIARDVGSNDFNSVKKLIGNLFSILLLFSVLLSVGCYAVKDNLLGWINTPIEAWDFTMDYTITCVYGLVFIYGYNIVSAILRGMGDSKRPFVFIAIAAVLNIVLDVLFVKYLNMKVFGAALATVIGQGVSFIASLVYLYVKREEFGFDFKLKSFAFDKVALQRIVKLGVPMAIQSAAISISRVIIVAWINSFGLVYSALSGLVNKVNVIVNVVANSFTAAGSTMVGQNLGAKKHDRVTKILINVGALSLGLITLGALAIIFYADGIFRIFTSDEAVLGVSGIVVIPMILNFYGAATRSVAFSLINGSGNTKLNLAVALIDGIISRIGIAWVLCFALGYGCQGCWYGDSIAGFMPMVIGLVYYLSGRWKK